MMIFAPVMRFPCLCLAMFSSILPFASGKRKGKILVMKIFAPDVMRYPCLCLAMFSSILPFASGKLSSSLMRLAFQSTSSSSVVASFNNARCSAL